MDRGRLGTDSHTLASGRSRAPAHPVPKEEACPAVTRGSECQDCKVKAMLLVAHPLEGCSQRMLSKLKTCGCPE